MFPQWSQGPACLRAQRAVDGPIKENEAAGAPAETPSLTEVLPLAILFAFLLLLAAPLHKGVSLMSANPFPIHHFPKIVCK